MRPFIACCYLFVLVSVLTLFGCQDFFTHSLASSLARNQSDLVGTVTTSNLNDYVKLSGDNPELALAVLDGINDSATSATGSALLKYQVAAADVAGNSSELGSIFYDLANEYLNDSSTDILSVIDTSLDGLPQLSKSSVLLLSILPDPSDTAAFDAFVAEASQDQLAIAAVVIISAQATANAGGVEAYFNALNPAAPTTAAETLAVALAKAASEKVTNTGLLSDILDQLSLVAP